MHLSSGMLSMLSTASLGYLPYFCICRQPRGLVMGGQHVIGYST